MAKAVRGRFAPSPSGRMHLGNVSCALLSWLAAKAAGGQWVLRIEDLDTGRCHEPFTGQVMDDLEWLGLPWDEGPRVGGPHPPYLQSQCGDLYRAALEKLAAQGLLYPCYCTRADLHAASAPHAEDGTLRYDGRCARLSPEEAAALAAIRPAALRVRVGDEAISFTDGRMGPRTVRLAEDSGDFVLQRGDGTAAYQLAVVVDDGRMGITQVVRGRDLLGSTARQLYLYRLLGLEPPTFTHMPLLTAPDGRRLSKRERDLDLGALRARYPSPEPLLGRLAFHLGLLAKPEPIDAVSLIPLFSPEKIPENDVTIAEDF